MREVDKSVSVITSSFQVDWHIKVIVSFLNTRVQQSKYLGLLKLVWNVLKHDCSSVVFSIHQFIGNNSIVRLTSRWRNIFLKRDLLCCLFWLLFWLWLRRSYHHWLLNRRHGLVLEAILYLRLVVTLHLGRWHQVHIVGLEPRWRRRKVLGHHWVLAHKMRLVLHHLRRHTMKLGKVSSVVRVWHALWKMLHLLSHIHLLGLKHLTRGIVHLSHLRMSDARLWKWVAEGTRVVWHGIMLRRVVWNLEKLLLVVMLLPRSSF